MNRFENKKIIKGSKKLYISIFTLTIILDVAIKELRKHISWYTKNLKNSSEFRNEMNKIETKKELINYIEEYFKTL